MIERPQETDLSYYEKYMHKIFELSENGDIGAMEDAFSLCRNIEEDGGVYFPEGHIGNADVLVPNKEAFKTAHAYNKTLRGIVARFLRQGYEIDALDGLYKRTLLFDAPHFFDEFCRVLEYNRPREKKFYEPRRKQLLPIVKDLQLLADGELKMLSISCPPGIGKTTIAEFFLAFMGGRNPSIANLCASHSNAFLNGVYNELIRIVSGEEYIYNEIFPNAKICYTNAQDMRIDLEERKRFQTYQFQSAQGGSAGKTRAANLLYCDDLVDGKETALSKDRLDKLWETYTTDLRSRRVGTCRELHIATRWSIHDPIGRLMQEYENTPGYKFIAYTATDENGESLWDYPYNLGFSTAYFEKQKEILDDATYRALYMNEPIEREGQLYSLDELKTYYSLPQGEPDGIIAVADIADGGGDYWSMPVAYIYGQEYYIDDWIFDDGKPEIVESRIAEMLMKHKVKMARFESNRGGGRVAETVQKKVRESGGITQITTKWNQTDKNTRIIMNSAWVKEHCLFKAENRSREYSSALTALASYTMAGKNKHDDAPDSLSMLAEYAQGFTTQFVTFTKRFF